MELTTDELIAKIDHHTYRKKKLEKLAGKIHRRIIYREECLRSLRAKLTVDLNLTLPLDTAV